MLVFSCNVKFYRKHVLFLSFFLSKKLLLRAQLTENLALLRVHLQETIFNIIVPCCEKCFFMWAMCQNQQLMVGDQHSGVGTFLTRILHILDLH